MASYAPAVTPVLLVEDDRVVVRVLEVNLRAAGFDVASASTGAAAVAAARTTAFAAIVCDLGLPDLSGAALVSALRDAAGGAPIVVVSGADPDAPSGGGYASAVEAVLRKPVEPDVIVETLRRVARDV
jgi:DNA-binding response OmpR family regulator